MLNKNKARGNVMIKFILMMFFLFGFNFFMLLPILSGFHNEWLFILSSWLVGGYCLFQIDRLEI